MRAGPPPAEAFKSGRMQDIVEAIIDHTAADACTYAGFQISISVENAVFFEAKAVRLKERDAYLVRRQICKNFFLRSQDVLPTDTWEVLLAMDRAQLKFLVGQSINIGVGRPRIAVVNPPNYGRKDISLQLPSPVTRHTGGSWVAVDPADSPKFEAILDEAVSALSIRRVAPEDGLSW